jgi:acetyl-CoA carboxylase carboxyltransferase component
MMREVVDGERVGDQATGFGPDVVVGIRAVHAADTGVVAAGPLQPWIQLGDAQRACHASRVLVHDGLLARGPPGLDEEQVLGIQSDHGASDYPITHGA